MPTDAQTQQAEQVESLLNSGPAPGPGDKASEMLSELFGNQWWEVLWSGQGVQGEPSLVMPILGWFNAIMMAAVCLILLYVVGHAMIGSAHEGTPLGRRLHSIWVPVRSVLAISFLAPIPKAECLNIIQGIVLAFVGFSIQFANVAMEAGIDYLTDHHGQVVATAPTDLTDGASDAARVALHNYMIQYHQAEFQDKPNVAGYQKNVIPPSSGLLGMGGTDYTKINYLFNNPEPYSEDMMGGVTIKCKAADSELCQARQDALEMLLDKMKNIAALKVEQLAGEDRYMPEPHEVNQLLEDYAHTVSEAIKDRIDRENPELKKELSEFRNAMKEQGFAMLGSYFWVMSRFSTALQDQVSSTVSAADYSSKLLAAQTVTRFNQIEINLKAMDSYYKSVNYSRSVAELGGGSINEEDTEKGKLAKILESLSDRLFMDQVDGFIKSIASGDPVSSLSAWGHTMMKTVYIAAMVLFGLLMGGSSIPIIGDSIAGAAGNYIVAIGFFFLAPIFFLGFILAYYLPAVPFIIWSISFFSWIIMVLEALVAAPVWAVMHASPDGEGIAGDKGAQGYTIFLQVLMRPVLMVIGFFFALLLTHVASYFGEMFSVFFHGLTSTETFAGPLTMAAGMFIGGTLMVVLVHKAFHLVFVLPERVVEWMGSGGAAKMGESGDVKETNTAIVGGAAITRRTQGRTAQSHMAGLDSEDKPENKPKDESGGGQGGAGGMQGGAGGQSDDHMPGQT